MGACGQAGFGTGGGYSLVGDGVVFADDGSRRCNGGAAHSEGSGPDNHVLSLAGEGAAGNIVVGHISGDFISIVALAQGVERQTVVNPAVEQGVLLLIGAVIAGDGGRSGGILAGVDSCVYLGQAVVLGAYKALDVVEGTLVQVGSHVGIVHTDIVVQEFLDSRFGGRDIAAVHLIPVLPCCILVQGSNHQICAGSDGLHGGGAAVHRRSAGILHHSGGTVGGHQQMGIVSGTLAAVGSVVGLTGQQVVVVVLVGVACGIGRELAFPVKLPDVDTAVVGIGIAAVVTVDLGQPLGDGVKVRGGIVVLEPALGGVDTGFITGFLNGLDECLGDFPDLGTAKGRQTAVLSVEVNGKLHIVGLDKPQNSLGFANGFFHALSVRVNVNAEGNIVVYAALCIFIEVGILGIFPGGSQECKINIILEVCPVNIAVPLTEVNAETGDGVGVGVVGDDAAVALDDERDGGLGQCVIVINIIADDLSSKNIGIHTGVQGIEGHLIVDGAAGQRIGVVAGTVTGGELGLDGQIIAPVHGGSDGTQIVDSRSNGAANTEGSAFCQRCGSNNILDGNIAGQVIHQSSDCGIDIERGIVIKNLIPIGIGGVLNQALNGEHGVCGDGVLYGGSAVGSAGAGIGHQHGNRGGLYAEVGSVGGAACQICTDRRGGLCVDTYERQQHYRDQNQR